MQFTCRTATRSPGPTPNLLNADASRFTRSSSSEYVMRRPSKTSASRSGTIADDIAKNSEVFIAHNCSVFVRYSSYDAPSSSLL